MTTGFGDIHKNKRGNYLLSTREVVWFYLEKTSLENSYEIWILLRLFMMAQRSHHTKHHAMSIGRDISFTACSSQLEWKGVAGELSATWAYPKQKVLPWCRKQDCLHGGLKCRYQAKSCIPNLKKWSLACSCLDLLLEFIKSPTHVENIHF